MSGAGTERKPGGELPWLTHALNGQAEEHQPDTGRIRAHTDRLIAERSQGTKGWWASRRRRIGRAGSHPRLRSVGFPRGILAVAVSATVVSIVAVVVSVGAGTGPPQRPANPIAIQAQGGSSTAATSGGSSGGLAAASATTVHQVQPSTAGGTAARTGGDRPTRPAGPSPTAPTSYVTAIGAVGPHNTDVWAEEDVTVALSRDVYALQITVKVSGDSGLSSTGTWTTLNPSMFAVTVNQVAGGMVYDFTLDSGQTVNAGTYEFGFQFDHTAGTHSFADDTYYASMITTKAEGSNSAAASGAF